MKQKITLDAIEYFINEHGYSPTIREVADMLGQSVHPVQEKIYQLELKGYIASELGKARTIRVIRSVKKPSDDGERLHQTDTKEKELD